MHFDNGRSSIVFKKNRAVGGYRIIDDKLLNFWNLRCFLRRILLGNRLNRICPVFFMFLISIFENFTNQFLKANTSTSNTTTANDALAQAAQLELGQNPNALAIRRPFDPTAHDLEANFRLTRYNNIFISTAAKYLLLYIMSVLKYKRFLLRHSSTRNCVKLEGCVNFLLPFQHISTV